MASSSQAASSRQSALYICAAEDPNGAFQRTEEGFKVRVAATNIGSDCKVFESIDAVSAYVEREYPDGLARLYIRAHGSQVEGRGAELVLKDSAEGGQISLSASGKQLEMIKKICQAVQPGGTLIVEGCYSGLGKDNLLKFLASLCRPDVLVVGSKGSEFEVGFDPVLNLHTRFTDVNTKADLSRVYYSKDGKTQHIPVRQFDLLWDAFRSKIDPNDHATLQRAYRLCYQLLGERNDPKAFVRIKEENQEFIRTLLGNPEELETTFKGMPFSKKDAEPAWQAALTELERCKDAFGYTGTEEISLNKDDRLGADDTGVSFTSYDHRYVAAYRFLLGCAAVEQYKTLLMLHDNGNKRTLENPAALLIHALANLSIHTNYDQSITHTLAKDFPTLKESFLLAKKHEQHESGLLKAWFTTVIGASTGACFDNYIERNAIFYFTRLAIENNVGVKVAVQNSDSRSFDRFMANGADLDYLHSDGRTLWDIALQTSTPAMLAKLVFAYPRDRHSILIQDIVALGVKDSDICDLLIDQKDFDQALQVARALPDSLQKMDALRRVWRALFKPGDLVQAEQIRLEIFQMLSVYFQKTYGEDIGSLPSTMVQIRKLLGRALSDEDQALCALANATELPFLRNLPVNVIRNLLNSRRYASELSQITALNLSNRILKLLPAEIGRFTGLRRLHLEQNQLKSLPEQIGSLGLLQKLSLSGNQLKSLPEQIGNLTALREFSLSNNQFKSLPPEIGSLTALVSLFLSYNHLTSLPAEIRSLYSLRGIYLNMNQLKSLPTEIGKLTYLDSIDLNNNQLTYLPPWICNFPALEYLILFGNPLMFISDEELAKGLTLSSIHKQHENFIQYQPQSSLGKLFQLIGTNRDPSLIHEAFSALPPELQQRISLPLAQSPTPSSSAASSSEGSDMSIFALSVRKATYGAFKALTPELKDRVYEEISRLAGNDDMRWGKEHAFDHVLRFCDALNKIIG